MAVVLALVPIRSLLLRLLSLLLLMITHFSCPKCNFASASSTTFVELGFSTQLIHRDFLDAPDKPLMHRYHDAYNRGLSRMMRRFGMSPTWSFGLEAAQTQVHPENGQYVMKVSMGTPPFDIYALVDTGSDLFWAQCLPCDHCYNQTKPKYDPKASSTYSNIPCQSPDCNVLEAASCAASSPGKCNYTYGYASTGYSRGFLAKETLTFSDSGSRQKTISLTGVIFGCGHNNSDMFSASEMGLMGLGRGRASFITQMGTRFGSRKFSHCLVPFHTDPSISSKISFGSGSEVSGPGVVSTPLVQGPDPTYYFVKLDGISVGDTYLPFYSAGEGTGKDWNMFLDSGTPPTIVPKDFYNRLENQVRSVVKLQPIDDPQLRPQLCYGKEVLMEGPILTAHFSGGANVTLVQGSVFISPKEGIYCFALVPNDNEGGIFGNFAQSNQLVGFDLENNRVSFKHIDCTKY